MTRRGKVLPALGFGAVTLLVIVMSPAVLLAGELLNRRYLYGGPVRYPRERVMMRIGRRGPVLRRRVRGRRPHDGAHPLSSVVWSCRAPVITRVFLTNPVWIALTAPARWVLDHLRPRVGRNGNGNGPPGAGVREPRRPMPDLPAGAIALPDPYQPG
jgi:hypothetical protein